MTTELMVRFVEGRPFVPFEFVTSDGRTIQVPHSDYAMLERYAASFFVYSDDGSAEFFDTSHVVSIRTLQTFD